MTNLNQAAHLIMEAARESELPTETAVNAVEALANAGLLAPELPAPTHDMRDPKWQKEYEAAWDNPHAPSIWDATALYEVGVFPGDNTITIWHDGLPLEPFTINEVKKLRQALHSAEHTAKEQA